MDTVFAEGYKQASFDDYLQATVGTVFAREKISSDLKLSPTATIYGINIATFFDALGTGIGNLAGILKKLSYIAKLGVQATWITPFFPSPFLDNGYDITDFKNVDPRFGSIDDFKKVVDEAHKLGLKVILDMVFSHTSNKHPWFEESAADKTNPKRNWYVWADPKENEAKQRIPPNNWVSLFDGESAWVWNEERQQYYLRHFLKEQPQLNLHNPEVLLALHDVLDFWKIKGVDGFRFDAADFLLYDRERRNNPVVDQNAKKPFKRQRHLFDMMQEDAIEIIAGFRRILGDRFSMCEFSSEEDPFQRIVEFSDGGKRLSNSGYTLKMARNEITPDLIRDAVKSIEAASERLRREKVWPVWTISIHDDKRLATRHPDPAFQTMLFFMLEAFPGIKCYMMGGPEGFPDGFVPADRRKDESIYDRDGCRVPLCWEENAVNGGFSSALPEQLHLPFDESHRVYAIERQLNDDKSVLRGFQRAQAFGRKHREFFEKADLKIVEPSDPNIFAFVRYTDNESMTFICNFSNEAKLVPYEDITHGIYTDKAGSLSGGLRVVRDGLEIRPYGICQIEGPGISKDPDPKPKEPDRNLVAPEPALDRLAA